MNWYYIVLLIIAAFLFMEFMAWFTHKYVMHGFLWVLHRDHHERDGRVLEWNDVFAVFFAAISIVLMYFGLQHGYDYKFWLGVGILFYGIAYFLFHDVYVHQRVRILRNFSNRYLRATVQAHKDHHTPDSRRNYGFLFAPIAYYREEFLKRSNIKKKETGQVTG